MRHLVIGHLGEVGAAVKKILELPGASADEVDGYDVKEEFRPFEKRYDFIHVCLPGDLPNLHDVLCSFRDSALTEEGILVIHSSVPLGTTKKFGDRGVHSPIRGVHPNLFEGIQTFVKFFGGARAAEAAKPFEERGLSVSLTRSPENTEAAKLWDTTAYGMAILVEKTIFDYCKLRHLDFDLVYRAFTETYNEGYEKLGRPEVRRPVLKHYPGKIGGHCVRQNAAIIGSIPLTRFLLDEDERLAAK